MTAPPQPPEPPPGSEPTVEASPLWGLVLVLGEIADRVGRRQGVEHRTDVTDGGTSRLDEPEEAAA